METVHFSNGDALASHLQSAAIASRVIICRECLIEGEVGPVDDLFWEVRARFISQNYGASRSEYFDHTVSEFLNLKNLPENSHVAFWFGNDLFCQTNLWFSIALLQERQDLNLYRVFAKPIDAFGTCNGFSRSTPAELEDSLAAKVALSRNDRTLAVALWDAYQSGDLSKLTKLADTKTAAFRNLKEVCEAHAQRFPDSGLGRPERLLKQLSAEFPNDFSSVFREFSKRDPIYGFGDSQVRTMLSNLDL